MEYEFRLPDLGEGLTEGEIGRWLVSEGQVVAEDDPLVEIQTDKTTVEIPSPTGGTVARICVDEGGVVPVGTVLILISTEAAGLGGALPVNDLEESPGGEAAPSAPRPIAEPQRVRATPLVRNVAQDLGVDLAQIAGSGSHGQVTEEDVRAAAGGVYRDNLRSDRRERLRGVRRVVAENLSRAHREIPPVTWVEECDFTDLGAVRGDISFVPFVLDAVAQSLGDFPELNARLEGEEIVYLADRHIGLSVQTDGGLVVPVVRHCDRLSVQDIASEAVRLGAGAKAGTLTRDELRGSTFTVTSAGKLAGLFQTPIINHPEVAILSVGRIGDRPVVREGAVVVRSVGTVGITFDHRVVDGVRAAAFGFEVIRRLEQPSISGWSTLMAETKA